MAKVTYRGPGDSVTIDGIEIAKGKSAALTPEQVVRLQADPTIELDVEHEPDNAESREAIRAAQDKSRDDATAAKAAPRAGKKEAKP
jgi:hypothetical protein